MNIDTIAEALWKASPGSPSWDMAGPMTKEHYRRMAQAAIDSLQLTEKWAVYSERNTRGEIVNTQIKVESLETANEIAEGITDKFWKNYRLIAGAEIIVPTPEVRSRWVSPWVEVQSS